MSKKYFGTDGIRGRVNQGNINGQMFFKFGLAAGTYFKNNFLCNTGGRIFSFTVRSKNLKDARTIVYKALTKIENESIFYRTDIGTY